MMRVRQSLLGAALAWGMVGCASAPMHYYTLMPPADSVSPDAAHAAAPSAAGLPFELLPVKVPAQVDQPQLVVREGGQHVALLEGERWIAPLGDEVRAALSAGLSKDLHSADVSGLPAGGQPRLRIQLDLRRFDSQLGRRALIEAGWSVRVLDAPHAGALACSSRVRESVGPGYDALVQGHQRALGRIAAQIAVVAQALGNGQAASCPASE
jgi:uncharacterized lipoprotein YmbA